MSTLFTTPGTTLVKEFTLVMSKYLEIGPPIVMIGLQVTSIIGMVVFVVSLIPVKLYTVRPYEKFNSKNIKSIRNSIPIHKRFYI